METKTRASSKLKTFGIIALIVLVGTTIARKVRAVNYLTFIVADIDIAFDNFTPVIKLELGIQNPSNEKFTVKSIVGTLYANGFEIGNVSSFQVKEINPASEVKYPLLIRLKVIPIVSDVVNILQGGNGMTQTLVFDGAVNANNMTSPLNITYKVF